MLKQKQLHKKLNNGFSLVEVIIGISLFSILFGSVLFGFSTMMKLEIKTKEKIYSSFKGVNEISTKYNITKNED